MNLSNLVKAKPACPPSDRLFKVVSMGLVVEEGWSVWQLHRDVNIAERSTNQLNLEIYQGSRSSFTQDKHN